MGVLLYNGFTMHTHLFSYHRITWITFLSTLWTLFDMFIYHLPYQSLSHVKSENSVFAKWRPVKNVVGGSSEQKFFTKAGAEEESMLIVHVLSGVRSVAGSLVGLLHQNPQWYTSLSLPVQSCWTGMGTSEATDHRKE